MPPDYNADRELGQGKKKWVVQPSTTNIKKSIMTGKGELTADDKGRFLVNDESLAREIQKDHRKDLTVSRIFMDDPADRGHTYFFGQLPEMPWKRDKLLDEGDDGPEQPWETEEGLDEPETFHGEGVA